MVELLAPAGDYQSYKVALFSGADAIYLAGKKFGARANASNFTNEEIKEIIKEAHFYDVKIYITINTICYDEEISEVIEFIDFLYLAGVDAIIIQDLGLINIIRKRYPDLDIHASTQLNVHSVRQAQFLKDLGVKRIILARELELNEIKEIIEKVKIEVEVFVHGALCYSYSGNCYFSSIVGKRSGNRGACAQPCRMLYEYENEKSYLMSMKDLNTLEYINKLCEINVTSFKIEGRLRKSEYVYVVVNSYKMALDAYYNKKHFDLKYHQSELQKVFSRGFTKGNLLKDDKKINFENPRHIGQKVGEVVKTIGDFIFIKFYEKVNNKDALRIVTPQEEDALIINDENIEKKIDIDRVVKFKAHNKNLLGGMVYKTSDYNQTKKMIELLNQKKLVKISGLIFLEDDYLCLEVTDGKNIVKEKSTEKVKNSDTLDFLDRIIQQVNKSQSYNFLFEELKMGIDHPIFLSISEINELRRRVLEKLKTIREQKYNRKIVAEYRFNNLPINDKGIELEFVAYTIEQLKALNDISAKTVYVPYDLYEKYKDDFKKLNLLYLEERIYTNREIDPQKTLMQVLSKNKFLMSSVYLNVANIYSVNLLHDLGVNKVGLSIELSKKQIFNLIKNYQKEFNQSPSLAVMVYGRYTLMVTKNCFIKEKNGCYKCEKSFYIKDRMKNQFPVIKRPDCSIEILNSKRICLLNNIKEMQENGIKTFLVYFTIEDYQETYSIANSYKKVFEGENCDLDLEDITFGYYNL